MTDRSGNGLLVSGAIMTVIGLCIVLLRVFQIPAYWIPLLVGLGLLLVGLVRRLASRGSTGEPR